MGFLQFLDRIEKNFRALIFFLFISYSKKPFYFLIRYLFLIEVLAFIFLWQEIILFKTCPPTVF